MSVFLSFLLAAIGTTLIAPLIIPILRKLKVGQTIREDGPKGHLNKEGTPTMGGILLLLPVMITALIVLPSSSFTIFLMIVIFGYGLIGFIDDYLKVVLKRALGLKARWKLGAQFILGLFSSTAVLLFLERGTEVWFPILGFLDFGWLYIPFAVLVLVGTTNAVNLTDGLDGLAAGTTAITAGGFLIVALTIGNLEAAIFAAALAGSCAAFLIFNFYPAKIFMGDTGSLALGAGLATLAILTKTEFILLLMGGVFVIETLSVIIQVVYFKLTGRRFFLMSPVHHHFELKGWSERKIVLSFYLVAIIFVIIGVLLAGLI